jgi:hypothetical protein
MHVRTSYISKSEHMNITPAQKHVYVSQWHWIENRTGFTCLLLLEWHYFYWSPWTLDQRRGRSCLENENTLLTCVDGDIQPISIYKHCTFQYWKLHWNRQHYCRWKNKITQNAAQNIFVSFSLITYKNNNLSECCNLSLLFSWTGSFAIWDIIIFMRTQLHSLAKHRPPLWSSGQSSWLQNGDVLCLLWGMN